jgi:hypothetical protein
MRHSLFAGTVAFFILLTFCTKGTVYAGHRSKQTSKLNKAGSSIVKDTLTIKVEVTGKGNCYADGDNADHNTFFIRISVHNNLDTVISLWVNCCTWFDNLVYDQKEMYFDIIGCDADYPVELKIEPNGEAIFYGTLRLRNGHSGDKNEQRKKFNIGFVILNNNDYFYHFFSSDKPIDKRDSRKNWREFLLSKKIYWSNMFSLEFKEFEY